MANTPVVSIEKAREHVENAKIRNISRIQADTQERKVLLAGMHEVNKLLTDLEVSREKVDALAATFRWLINYHNGQHAERQQIDVDLTRGWETMTRLGLLEGGDAA